MTMTPPKPGLFGGPLPAIDLRQMLRLTDDTGLFQHAVYSLPDPNHGYCIDDNARALIASLIHAQLRGYDESLVPMHRYLAFVAYAMNPDNGRFRNFMGYDRRWLEEQGSDDSHARGLWALGLATRDAPHEAMRALAALVFSQGLPAADQFGFHRSKAFTLLGLCPYTQARPEDTAAREALRRIAKALHEAYRAHATDDWPWWEDTLTYDNAKLPQALLAAGEALHDRGMIDDGLTGLTWLIRQQTAKAGHLSIIGNQGWLPRGGTRAPFDQQPLEAHALVEACLLAARLSDDPSWQRRARWALAWFEGHNDVGIPLRNTETGGCHDGLMDGRVNRNQGAESTLAYVLSVLEMHLHEQRSGPSAATETPAADVRLTAEARPLGYAVIGASSFAEFCMDSYAAHDRLSQRLKPLGVYSGSPQRAKDVAQRRGLRAYETIEDLLSEPTIDVVHIAGIPASHAQPAVAALQAGKHVLCEKPLAIDLPQAQLMTQAAAEAERRLGVNFMMRHGPLAESLGRLLDRGVLGAPLRCVSTNQAGDRGLPPDHWFWDESKSGGIFIEHGVHFFDLLRAWFGHAAVTHAWQQPRPGLPIVDQVGCSLAFEAGARVECYHGFLNAPPMDQQEHRMLLERGRLSLFGWVPRRIEVEAVLSFAQTEQLRAALPQGAEVRTLRELPAGEAYNSRRLHEEPADAHVFASWESAQDDQAVYAQALAALMSDFTQAVDEPTYRPRVTAQDGVEALRLAADARRLAQQRSIEQPSVRREPRRETTP